jgi:Fe-S-cluster containining protein
MNASRKDRRLQKKVEEKTARRALPLIKDNPIRAAIRTRYAMSLANGEPALSLLHQARAEAQAFAARIFAESAPPACAPGCSHCCENVRVGMGAAEARALAAHLRRLPAEQLAPIRERIAKNAALVREAPEGQHPGTFCALLDEERRCMAYDQRPFACRRAHSFDAERCRLAKLGEGNGIVVDARVLGMYSEIAMAFKEAHAAFGGDTRSYDFNLALDILLDDPKGDLGPAVERVDEVGHEAATTALNAALRGR